MDRNISVWNITFIYCIKKKNSKNISMLIEFRNLILSRADLDIKIDVWRVLSFLIRYFSN